MSFAQLVATLRAAALRIALMVLVASGVAFAVASTLPKQYTAKARVLLDVDTSDPDQAALFGATRSPDYIGTQLRLVADEAVTHEVVAKLGWADNPQVDAAWREATGGVGDLTDWAAARVAQGIDPRQLEDSAIIEIYYTANSVAAGQGDRRGHPHRLHRPEPEAAGGGGAPRRVVEPDAGAAGARRAAGGRRRPRRVRPRERDRGRHPDRRPRISGEPVGPARRSRGRRADARRCPKRRR